MALLKLEAFGGNMGTLSAAFQEQMVEDSFVRDCEAVTNETCPRVLLVDDDPFVLRAVRRLLCKYWNVEVASNAEVAAMMLATHRFHAIITDFDMPMYNGIWLLTQVALNYPATRRVLLSGSEPDMLLPHVRSGLVQRYLTKPANPDGLMACLN